jgi:hypothetical protein
MMHGHAHLKFVKALSFSTICMGLQTYWHVPVFTSFTPFALLFISGTTAIVKLCVICLYLTLNTNKHSAFP